MLLSFFITANLLFGLSWCFTLAFEGAVIVGTPSTISWNADLVTGWFVITSDEPNPVFAYVNSTLQETNGTIQMIFATAGDFTLTSNEVGQDRVAALAFTVSDGTSSTISARSTSTTRASATSTKTTPATGTTTSTDATSTSSSTEATGATSSFNTTVMSSTLPSVSTSTTLSGLSAMNGTTTTTGTSATVGVVQSTSPASHTTHSTSKAALIAVVVVLIIAIMIIGAFLLVRRRRRRNALLKLDSPSIPSAYSSPEMSSYPPSPSITPFLSQAPTSNSPSPAPASNSPYHSPGSNPTFSTSPDNTSHEPNSDLKIASMSFLSTDPSRISTRDVDARAPGDSGSTRGRDTMSSTWVPMSDDSHYDPPPTYRSRPGSQFS